MAGDTRPDILTDADYERLLALLGATSKGRVFLAEFATQARAEDTRALFAALAAIQSSLTMVREQLRPEAVAAELRRIAAALAEALERTGTAGPEVHERLAVALGKTCAELTALADALARGAEADGQEG